MTSENTEAVTCALEKLEARLPQLLCQYPSESDFWPAFSCEAWDIYDLAKQLTGSSADAIARVEAMVERAEVHKKLHFP